MRVRLTYQCLVLRRVGHVRGFLQEAEGGRVLKGTTRRAGWIDIKTAVAGMSGTGRRSDVWMYGSVGHRRTGGSSIATSLELPQVLRRWLVCKQNQ
jgi:hypothetical protein